MSAAINWRSGNLKIILTLKDKTTYELMTAQNIDFSFDDNPEVMDSLNQQRIGYFLAPRKIRITLTVLPTTYTVGTLLVNDAEKLSILQAYLLSNGVANDYTNAFFDIAVDDDHQGSTYDFTDCIVLEGSSGDILMDTKPVAQFTILALGADISPKAPASGGDSAYAEGGRELVV